MSDGKKVLALIPARGGSKRIPRKNVLTVGNKPLIAWTIEAALQSNCADRVVVSTDNEEISEVAIRYGAEIPFARPLDISTDHASTGGVIFHALEKLEVLGYMPEYLFVLQPTSPLRMASDIDAAFELMHAKNANCVISVTKIDHPIEWVFELGDDLTMEEFICGNSLSTRSQDFPVRYRLNGAIYLYKTRALLSKKNMFFPEGTFAYVMDKQNSVDIDDEADLAIADSLLTQSN